MMKKILIGLLFAIINIYSAHAPVISITHYREEHIADITKIAFQNPHELFETYSPENHDECIKNFQSTLKYHNIIKVILEDDKIVGYIKIFMRIEPSLSLIKQYFTIHGMPIPEDDILLQENPCLKTAIGNVQRYISIEEIAIDEKYRNKGYAKQLIENLIQLAKQHKHLVMKVKLIIRSHNTAAIQLAESTGFTLSKLESIPKIYRELLNRINSLQYEQYL